MSSLLKIGCLFRQLQGVLKRRAFIQDVLKKLLFAKACIFEIGLNFVVLIKTSHKVFSIGTISILQFTNISVRLSVCLLVCPRSSVCLFVCQFVHLVPFVYLFVSLSTQFRLSICLLVCPLVLFVYLFLSVSTSSFFCLFVCQLVLMFDYLSITSKLAAVGSWFASLL